MLVKTVATRVVLSPTTVDLDNYSLGKGIMKRKLRWVKKLNRENFIGLRSCLTRNVASKNTALNLPEEKCYLP